MAEDLFRGVLVFVHVTGVIVWLIALVSTSFIFRSAKACVKDGQIDLNLLKSNRNLIYLEIIALFFVFLTGSALAGPKWFSLKAGDLWLTVKQVIFLLLALGSILAIVVFKKYFSVLDSSQGPATDELLENIRKKMVISHVFSALILLNVFLAFVKPF